MSYPDLPSDFKQDNDALIAAAQQYQADKAKYEEDLKAYHEQVLAHLKSLSDPMEILMYLITNVFGSDKGSDATATGLQEDQLALTGDSLQVSAAFGKCQNDIEGIINGKSTDTHDITTSGYAMDVLLDETKQGGILDGTMDPEALLTLNQEVGTIRHQIYIQGDTSGYNPTDDSYTLTDDTSQKDKKITSYEELADLAGKPDGDAGASKGARDALKTITDSLQTATSTTQGFNSAENLTMQDLTNLQKNITSFANAMQHSVADVLSKTVSNQKVS